MHYQNLHNAIHDICGFLALESDIREIIDAYEKDKASLIIPQIRGMRKYTDTGWPIDEHQRIEKAKCAAYNQAIEDVVRLFAKHVVEGANPMPINLCTPNQETCGKGPACKYPRCHL